MHTFLLLDVRNDVAFGRYRVEGPYPIDMVHVPYMESIEMKDESVAKVSKGKKVRIVCAKEGSSKHVGEILVNHNYGNVAYMKVGIKAWGNLLAPIQVSRAADSGSLTSWRVNP
jgi:rhodanese-related sulfurtransferase